MVLPTTYDPSTRTWSGRLVKPLHDPNLSIATVVFSALSRNPDHIGQINDNNGVRLTNEQIRLNAVRLAISLQHGNLGVRRDDVIGLVAKNNDKVSAVVFAAFALAAPINTLDPNYKADEIAHMFRLTRPSIVFCDSDTFGYVRTALFDLEMSTNTPIVTTDRRVDGALFVDDLLVPRDNEHLFVPTVIEDGLKQTALIVCTSGTTGSSKGVSVSQALLLQQLSVFYGSMMGPEDVYLSFSSLYWLTGIVALVSGSMLGITRIITTSPFDPKLFLGIIERHGVTITLLTPYHLSQILQCSDLPTTNLSTLRHCLSGGCAIATDVLYRLSTFLPVAAEISNVYGTSEIGGLISGNVGAALGSVGSLKPGVSARIYGADGIQCGPNADGEVFVKHLLPMTGYCSDPVATAGAFDSDGWFMTGDIGHFDDDGNLFLVDRKKDILKCHGHQVSPSELEGVVTRCPGVAQVCVVGIWDDILSTHLPTAVVMKVPGHSVSEDDIEAIVKDTLSDAKQLRGGVFFVPELPLTPSGKVIRRKVLEMVIGLRH